MVVTPQMAMASSAFEVSLLLESVGLTMDKVMRCAAGIHEALGDPSLSFV